MLSSFLASWACRVFLQLSYLEVLSKKQTTTTLNVLYQVPHKYTQVVDQGGFIYLSKLSLFLTSSSADACFVASLSADTVATGDAWKNNRLWIHRRIIWKNTQERLIPQISEDPRSILVLLSV